MLFFNLLFSISWAAIPRISSHHADLSKVGQVYMAPGLVSVFEFPQNIIEVRIGDPKSVKVLISQVSAKELTVYLSSSASKSTNLIVRSEKRIFVIDVIPSQKDHQDFVRIRGAYGTQSHSNMGLPSEVIEIAPKKQEKLKAIKMKNQEVIRVGP